MTAASTKRACGGEDAAAREGASSCNASAREAEREGPAEDSECAAGEAVKSVAEDLFGAPAAEGTAGEAVEEGSTRGDAEEDWFAAPDGANDPRDAAAAGDDESRDALVAPEEEDALGFALAAGGEMRAAMRRFVSGETELISR